MDTNHASSAIPYAWPDQVLDPYPERSTSLGGVRKIHPTQTTEPSPGQWDEPGVAYVVFAAAVDPEPAPARSRRLPILSTALNALGQVVLGASIATGTVSPAVGAATCLLWMVCGLMLIVAEWTGTTRGQR